MITGSIHVPETRAKIRSYGRSRLFRQRYFRVCPVENSSFKRISCKWIPRGWERKMIWEKRNTKKERRNTGADGGGRVGRGRGGDRRKRRVELDGNTDRRNAEISLGSFNDMQEYRSSSWRRWRISDIRLETLRKWFRIALKNQSRTVFSCTLIGILTDRAFDQNKVNIVEERSIQKSFVLRGFRWNYFITGDFMSLLD